MAVNIASDHFFPDAAFAGQQHGRIGLRHAGGQGEEILAGRILRDDAGVVQHRRQPVTRHVFEQGLRLERLQQKIAGAGAHCLDGPVDFGKRGHQHHRQMRQLFAYRFEQRDAIHRHHPDIAHHQCDRMVLKQAQGFLAAAGRNHRLPGQFKRIAHRLAQIGIVFNDQNRQVLTHLFSVHVSLVCASRARSPEAAPTGSCITNSDPSPAWE